MIKVKINIRKFQKIKNGNRSKKSIMRPYDYLLLSEGEGEREDVDKIVGVLNVGWDCRSSSFSLSSVDKNDSGKDSSKGYSISLSIW